MSTSIHLASNALIEALYNDERVINAAAAALAGTELAPELKVLVKAVKKWANDNYDKLGWDILVECYGDKSIAAAIGGAYTTKGAINNCWQKLVKNEYYARREVRGHAF